MSDGDYSFDECVGDDFSQIGSGGFVVLFMTYHGVLMHRFYTAAHTDGMD